MAHEKYVALIAHDGMKSKMVEFATTHRDTLAHYRLLGTATTGARLAAEAGLDVETVLSGPLGGDVQIGARVATGEVAAVIFFIDPLGKHPHEPDIQSLLRMCNVHDVALATNAATAALVISARSLAD
jgi:methylglyoxal synthase